MMVKRASSPSGLFRRSTMNSLWYWKISEVESEFCSSLTCLHVICFYLVPCSVFSTRYNSILLGCRTAAGSPGGNNGSPGGGDQKRVRRPYQAKTFKVELNFAATIPMAAIGQAIRGQESEHSLEALRVLDIILRQHSAKQYVSYLLLCLLKSSSVLKLPHDSGLCFLMIHRGCLLVRQSFFHNNPSSFVDLGGGVMGCRGFHSSFRGTQSGLSLNIGIHLTTVFLYKLHRSCCDGYRRSNICMANFF